MVAPGTYVAKLKIGETTLEQSFDIVMDPRVEESGVSAADIKEQIAMQQKVQNLLSETRILQDKLEKEAKKLKGKKAADKKARLDKVNAVLKKIKNDRGAYPQQMFGSQVSYLLNMISGADQLPGQEATNRFKELTDQYNKLKQEAEE